MLPEWTVVGFSGHRKLADPKAAAAGIYTALERLAARHGPLAAVSSAASGADTLFVEEVARRQLPYMIILPFALPRFQEDFEPADWRRILPLIESAPHVDEVAGEESAADAYMETGILTVDRADVIVVLWDGKPAAGVGGTGDVVDYARELGKPLLLIDPNTGGISEERLSGLPVKSSLPGWSENPRVLVKKHFEELDDAANRHAPRARNLVLYIIVLQLAAAAVGLVALEFENYLQWDWIHPVSTLLELSFLGGASVLLLQHHQKHRGWTTNRISAEICRSFLATWDLRRMTDHSPNISIQGFNSLCRNLRLIRTLDKTSVPGLAEVRDRYLNERVNDQLSYFLRESMKARTRHQWLRRVAFWSTAAATGLSSLSFGLWCLKALHVAAIPAPIITLPKDVSLLLPLAATALFSLMVTQDYSRRAVRYREMADLLEEAANRLKMVQTWNSLARIAMETEEKLLQEIVEWHSFRQFAGEPR